MSSNLVFKSLTAYLVMHQTLSALLAWALSYIRFSMKNVFNWSCIRLLWWSL